MVKTTISLIKADVGSVAGHSIPHPKMFEACRKVLKEGVKNKTIKDFYVTRVGDDMQLIMTHDKGENNKDIHKLAWSAFLKATEFAKKYHLYGAGQDLLSDAFSGNVKGMGPGAAEMEFEERKSEPTVFFMADKTEPSAYSLPLSKIFMDPFTTTGLVIDSRMQQGFNFEIQDVIGNKGITLSTPEESYEVLSLISDTYRYAIKRIWCKDEKIRVAAVVSTDKLNVSAGHYVGKDDPVAIVRSQSGLPAIGEILQPFAFPQLVAGWMRGSHYGAWYPCSVADSSPTYFDGPPRLCAIGFQICDGTIVGLEDPERVESAVGEHIPLDYFEGSVWDVTRRQSMNISRYMRGHGPFMPGTLASDEMEYTTKPEVLKKLADRMKPLF